MIDSVFSATLFALIVALAVATAVEIARKEAKYESAVATSASAPSSTGARAVAATAHRHSPDSHPAAGGPKHTSASLVGEVS